MVYLAPLEAMMRIKKEKTTGKLPIAPYWTMAVNGVVWTSYGVLVQQPSLWLGAAPGILFGAYYWSVFSRYAPKECPLRAYKVGGAVSIGAIAGVCSTLDPATAAGVLGTVGNLGTMLMIASPLAAIKTVTVEQSTRSLPFGLSAAVFVNSALWTSYGVFVTQDPFLCVSNGIGLLLASLQMCLFVRYGLPPRGGVVNKLEVARH